MTNKEENYEWEFNDEIIIDFLNRLQKQKKIKIIDYEFPITITLRKKLEKEIVPEINNWIDEWSDLWKGKKVSSATAEYYLAQPPSVNLKRMQEFVKENKFNKEIIFAATKKYLDEKEAQGFNFTKKSHKFIQDLDGSTLYAYCQAIELGETVPKSLNTRL